jgi:uncharacterized protein (DUF1778 family)
MPTPPRNARRIQVNFRLGSAEHKRMKKAANDDQRTVADFVRTAVNEKIDRLERMKQLAADGGLE